MANKGPLEDLSDRLVGQRFYNTEIDESFTVVGMTPDGLMVYIQYDDGTQWDEMASPNLLPEERAAQLGVKDGGIDDSHYVPLGRGPTVEQACGEDEHQWFPLPSELSITELERWKELDEKVYLQMIRCKKCGLSGDVALGFLGHQTPEMCRRCESEILPGESDITWSATSEWMDQPLCETCLEEIDDES